MGGRIAMKLCLPQQAYRLTCPYPNCSLLAIPLLFGALSLLPLHGQELTKETCARPQTGSVVAEPPDVRSKNGVLEITLTAHNAAQPDGTTRYCFVDEKGQDLPICA